MVLYSLLPRVVEPFGKATFLKEGRFKLPELLIKKVIGLVNQTDDRVGGDLG